MPLGPVDVHRAILESAAEISLAEFQRSLPVPAVWVFEVCFVRWAPESYAPFRFISFRPVMMLCCFLDVICFVLFRFVCAQAEPHSHFHEFHPVPTLLLPTPLTHLYHISLDSRHHPPLSSHLISP